MMRDITSKFLQLAIIQKAETYQEARAAAEIDFDAPDEEEEDILESEYEKILALKKEAEGEAPDDIWVK
jgi:hypothetical protein